jgi:hypothetical protein
MCNCLLLLSSLYYPKCGTDCISNLNLTVKNIQIVQAIIFILLYQTWSWLRLLSSSNSTKCATACVYYLHFTMPNVQVFSFFCFYIGILNLQLTFVTFVPLYQEYGFLCCHYYITVLNLQLILKWKIVQLWCFVHYIE